MTSVWQEKRRKVALRWTGLLIITGMLSATAHSQNSPPIISGGAAMVSNSSGGTTSVQPIVAPVLAAPLGTRFLVEGRADLREFLSHTDGNWSSQGFASLEYLQLDYIANSRMTLTVGRYLTPFGIYNERLTPVWIRNLQNVPLIFPLGTRTTASSNGVMARGDLLGGGNLQVNYTAYYSASSTVHKFEAGRTAGGRIGVYVPAAGLEIGGSYQRFLESVHVNCVGAHLAWQPPETPLDMKGEFARSPSGYGYWFEAATRAGDSTGSWPKRFQPVIRIQQFVRKKQIAGDLLPARNTQQLDLGVNYYLPGEVRLQASYGRAFSSGGDANVWTFAITHRFLFPLWRGAQ